MKKSHAIIVGMGPGVGLGVAKAFADEGFNLTLLSRSVEKLRDSVPVLIGQGASVECLEADAGDHSSLTQAIARACEILGPPEVLVFNVLGFSQGPPSKVDPTVLTSDFHTNVSAALACVRAVLPAMLSRNSGTVIFTGGGWALYPSADFASVSIDKQALRSLAFLLTDELQGTGVRVGTVTIMGTVSPGTAFDPAKIGRSFVELYRQPVASFPVELQFKGA